MIAFVHAFGIMPDLLIVVNKAAKGGAHKSGWNFSISVGITSGPGAFPDFSWLINAKISSGDTGGHSGTSVISDSEISFMFVLSS